MLWNGPNATLSICDGKSVSPRRALPFLSDGRVNIIRSPLNGSYWLPCSVCLPAAPKSQGQIDSRHRAAHVALQETQCAQCPEQEPQGRWDHRCSLFHTGSSIVQLPPQAIFPPLPYSKNALHQQLCSISGPHCISIQTDTTPKADYLVAMKRWPKPFA